MKAIIGICGIGMVGSAMLKSFILKEYVKNKNLFLYDKYKEEFNDKDSILKSDILFLSLPTLFNESLNSYNLEPIYETCQFLTDNNYHGTVVLKSTVQPKTVYDLSIKYKLNMVHNPEFLTARTAFDDFHYQKHIVLGREYNCSQEHFDRVYKFYKINYPDAEFTLCTSNESESMKLFVNSFYAVKIQFFTEIYLLCEKMDMNFEMIRDMMLKNKWINHMHTIVPGPDGQISYGGMCLPKDIRALKAFMEDNNTLNGILESTIREQVELRK